MGSTLACFHVHSVLASAVVPLQGLLDASLQNQKQKEGKEPRKYICSVHLNHNNNLLISFRNTFNYLHVIFPYELVESS